MRIVREWFYTLLAGTLLMQPSALPAQSADAQDEPPWFEFEVLVFERIAPGAGTTEGWPDDPGRPDSSNAAWFSRGEPMDGNEPIAYRALPAEERSLDGAWGQMRRSRDYRPLYHVAWRQPVDSPERAKQIYFALSPEDGGEASDFNPPKLEGSLKFSIKRYLHVEADIALHRLATGAESQVSGDNFGFAPRFKHYRMQQRARMRRDKLRYFDHPVLGMLIIAHRYEPPQPEVIETIETPVPVPTIVPTDKLNEAPQKAQ